MKPFNNINHEVPPDILPVVPTMDVVVFPNMIVPLLVLDERIIRGINNAIEHDSKRVFLLASKKDSENFSGSISTKDLYQVGTVATIMRLVKVPEGGVKILIQGLSRAQVADIYTENDILKAEIQSFNFIDDNEEEPEIEQEIKNIKDIAEKISSTGSSLSPDFYVILSKMQDKDKIADFVLSHLNLKINDAQAILECKSRKDALRSIYEHLCKEFHVNEIQENIKTKARESMNRSQREFYLREQMNVIRKELGDDSNEEVEKMRSQLESLNLPKEVYNEAQRQLNRLDRMSQDSMESSVTRNHLDWVFSLPWNNQTVDNLDINHAKTILDEEHFGLKEIKERILDFISIKKLKSDGFCPILCFSGPPGTGKTSLGKSIAKSLGRNCFRISLGGVKDEAEIRGHRRTYVGAMPGRFIQGIRKAGSSNPVIIIDELDKIGADFRGDPSAAMLEVLDPQQNKSFYDNYLGFPFDLSKVIFIATANAIQNLSEPLQDRLEIIHLPGYVLEEKVSIAKQHLIKKAISECGLENYNLEFSDELLFNIISGYTRESGVRELERIIKKLCSKTARAIVEEDKLISFTPNNLDLYLGPRRFKEDEIITENFVGITNGLAWTSCGGELIKIEAVIIPGKGKLILTGSLGNVMQESAKAALSYAKSHTQDFNIDPKMFTEYDIHIHVPSGAIPKDGPSAGVTMLSSILSALTGRAIDSSYAMTGEISLQGRVMAIGGVKEKILAAKRNKVKHVILPENNKSDLVGSENIAKDVDLIFVSNANDILKHVLMPIKTIL